MEEDIGMEVGSGDPERVQVLDVMIESDDEDDNENHNANKINNKNNKEDNKEEEYQ